jgi:hypothetical protein
MHWRQLKSGDAFQWIRKEILVISVEGQSEEVTLIIWIKDTNYIPAYHFVRNWFSAHRFENNNGSVKKIYKSLMRKVRLSNDSLSHDSDDVCDCSAGVITIRDAVNWVGPSADLLAPFASMLLLPVPSPSLAWSVAVRSSSFCASGRHDTSVSPIHNFPKTKKENIFQLICSQSLKL